MLKKLYPTGLLMLTGTIALAAGIVMPKKWVDIHIYSTFFVFTFSSWLFVLAAILLLSGFAYLPSRNKKKPNRFLVICPVLSLVTAIYLVYLLHQASKAYSASFSDWSYFETINLLIVLDTCLFFLLQLIFAVVFIIRTIRQR
jgi:hypothetical protein